MRAGWLAVPETIVAGIPNAGALEDKWSNTPKDRIDRVEVAGAEISAFPNFSFSAFLSSPGFMPAMLADELQGVFAPMLPIALMGGKRGF